jgi:hypothetical protein
MKPTLLLAALLLLSACSRYQVIPGSCVPTGETQPTCYRGAFGATNCRTKPVTECRYELKPEYRK